MFSSHNCVALAWRLEYMRQNGGGSRRTERTHFLREKAPPTFCGMCLSGDGAEHQTIACCLSPTVAWQILFFPDPAVRVTLLSSGE